MDILGKNKINKTTVYVALIVSAAAIFVGSLLYLNAERERNLREQELQSLLLLQQNTSASEDLKNTQLGTCLSDVDSRFAKIAEGKPNLTVDGWKLILDEKQRQKDDCYRRYQ